jgi:hypothetical protein
MNGLLLAAGHLARTPPSRLALALLPLMIIPLAIDIYCLADIIRARSVRHLPKIVWALLVCISFPFGALLYLFAGKVRNQGSRVPGR